MTETSLPAVTPLPGSTRRVHRRTCLTPLFVGVAVVSGGPRRPGPKGGERGMTAASVRGGRTGSTRR